MKGQVSYPFTMLEAGLTFLLVIGVAYGTQDYTQQFIKEETADTQAQRVKNAAMALNSFPKGHIELEISEYSFKVEDGNVSISFRDTNHTVRIEEDVASSNINGPEEFTELDGLCIRKKPSDSTMDFKSGDC